MAAAVSIPIVPVLSRYRIVVGTAGTLMHTDNLARATAIADVVHSSPVWVVDSWAEQAGPKVVYRNARANQ